MHRSRRRIANFDREPGLRIVHAHLSVYEMRRKRQNEMSSREAFRAE
jgi:hypothetical protein